uniref:Steroidogenic acute regulatory protein, mitochondrial n=1 Tax=Anser cygnoides TaxID=8845 RepID=A0A8B9DQH9_ANSCY
MANSLGLHFSCARPPILDMCTPKQSWGEGEQNFSYFSAFTLAPKARCTEPGGDIGSHRFSGTDLSYIHQGERALQRALSILSGAFGGEGLTWRCAPQDAGAAVSSAVLPGLGRVFRVEAVLAAPVGWLHRELFEELEQMPRWNPSLSRVEVLQRLGEDTLVTHEVTATSPVGRRDFVSVRHRRRTQAAVYLVGTAARLECTGAGRRPRTRHPGSVLTLWVLSLPQGWIPAAVTDRVLPRCQADFIGHLRQHLSHPQNLSGCL